MKFDGKGFAKTIEESVAARAHAMEVRPKIVSVLVGNDPASILYTGLKQKAAERVGIDFEVVRLGSVTKEQIKTIAQREDVTGLMIQLPVPGLHGQALAEILQVIPYEKDVDGLRYPESGVVPPVVRAVVEVMHTITNLKFSNSQIEKSSKIVVVGAAGFVGSGVVSELAKLGLTVVGVERGDDMEVIKAGDIVISAVGEEGVIKSEMVKEGAIVIDVGAPKGDMAVEVYQKASVSVEVPGGVGPVTIACLMENACNNGH
ncbi:bifunctional 5,10-methylenetetrahydrofolate dehydrogenase/5,10-methenyltetrahydrofolate cyclohydrolase [Candidatus Woesebacteria bacterium]|nr:bifunctional 5,10-methylenetetrahydrofolate dehydrogenase/5,10-methenyltetrahydrofolate cyclohydrolase [Candidatus Woesebacteria bacterium]